jgi:carboxypeptidase Taq
LGEVSDLQKALQLLNWDQSTMMPPGGARVRGAQFATLARVIHERFASDETGRLIDAAAAETASLPDDSNNASLVRVTRIDWDKARRVPVELRAEMAAAEAEGYVTWLSAKAANDVGAFRPVLERHLELKRRYIGCFPEAAEPWDALFDDFERGMTAAEVRVAFDRLKEGLRPLVKAIAANPEAVSDAVLRQQFPVEAQDRCARALVTPWGFSSEQWRLDPTHHPFASSLSPTDVRLTTRYNQSELGTGLRATMHEMGHGLYEAGVDPDLVRTPLCRGCSLALHESQSRLWENLVGASRPFWTHAGPILREHFPEQLGKVDDDTLHRAMNRMEPSLIRVEADEVTYSLHIIVRFELEQEIFNGGLTAADIPEAWNAKMREYLGIEVPEPAQGYMQDVHWATGGFGYFPTYALGNILSAQIWERLLGDVPTLPDQIAGGEFAPLREWLRQHLHRHGRKFTPKETIRLVTGTELDPEPYLRYLTQKVTELYGAPAS